MIGLVATGSTPPTAGGWTAPRESVRMPRARMRAGRAAGIFLLLVGYALFCHGCHGDEDNELFALLNPRTAVRTRQAGRPATPSALPAGRVFPRVDHSGQNRGTAMGMGRAMMSTLGPNSALLKRWRCTCAMRGSSWRSKPPMVTMLLPRVWRT